MIERVHPRSKLARLAARAGLAAFAEWREEDHPRDEGGKFSTVEGGGGAATAELPPRTADTMGDAIAQSSPSGSMSGRARSAAQERLRQALFGPEGLQLRQIAQPDEATALRRQAAELKDLASRGMHPKAYAAKAAELEQKADAADLKVTRDLKAKHEHSLFAFVDPATGALTPERSKLHQAIVDGHFVGKRPVPEGQTRTYYALGGGSGSGKTSLLKSGLITIDDATTITVDPDKIKAQIPEFMQLKNAGDLDCGGWVHEESSKLGKQTVAAALGRGHNVLLDGTGDGSVKSLRDKLKAARAAGLRVVGEYATCSVDSAIARAKQRAITHPDRGEVAETVIRHTHGSVSSVMPQVMQEGLFDECRVWDTEGAVGSPPRLIAEWRDGKLDVKDPKGWDAFLEKGKAWKDRPD